MKTNPLIPGTPDEFIQANKGLVHNVCKKFDKWLDTNKAHADYDDLSQAGHIGLMFAYEHYNKPHIKFSTYATQCIHGYVMRCINNLHQGPTFSEHAKTTANLIIKQNLGEKSAGEIAKVLKISNGLAQSGLDHIAYSMCVSADFKYSDDSDEPNQKILPHRKLITNVDYDKQLIVDEFFKTLSDRQQQVLKMMCDGYSGADVARELNLTRSYTSLVFQQVLKLASAYGSTLNKAS